jgi:VCBS repeat-containing protein
MVFADNTTYYVDATFGSDTASGTTQGTPWQSLDRINTESLLPWDQILLKCGEAWTGQILLDDSGNSGSQITYGSYGTCNPSNKPIIASSWGISQVTVSGSISNIEFNGLNFMGDALVSVDVSGSGNTISILNSSFSNSIGSCIQTVWVENYLIDTNTFSGCTNSVILGSGAGIVSGNAFSNILSGSAIAMSLESLWTRQITQNIFTNIAGSAIQFGQNSQVTLNYITEACLNSSTCGAIENIPQDDFSGTFLYDTLDLNVSISDNFIENTGLNSPIIGYRDAVYLGNLSRSVTVSNNTLSWWLNSIHIKNGRLHTISNNTLYNPRANALLIEETSEAYTWVVQGNTVIGNTIFSANPDYAMVRLDDMVDQNGTLATLTANNYLNLYKSKLPVIQVLRTGGDSTLFDKDSIWIIDASSQNFTAFWNRVYTSTGSYSGATLLSNGNFSANIVGWSTDVLGLIHDSTGWTLHVSQWADSLWTLSSNSFSITSGARYEISGRIKNLTNSEWHRVHVLLRKNSAPYTVYADRVLDVVATASGTNFLEYVVANTTASDARLDFVFENPNSDFELDTLLVRQKQNVIFNARANEIILLSNPTNSSIGKNCSWGLVCSEYVDIYNSPLNWNSTPINLGSYSSKLVLWNNSPYVLRPPTCTLLPSNGWTVANGQPITLTWTANNSLSNLLHYITNTGTIDATVANSGAIWFIPPDDVTSHNLFTVTNDIGSDVCTADIVASNTPPIAADFFWTGSEDSAIITGSLQAIDFNSWDTITYSKIDDPVHGTLFVLTDWEIQYTPNPDYCWVDTFTFQARDNNGHTSDITNGQIQVLCVNDAPVVIDDSVTMPGNSTLGIDPRTNDSDVDSPFVPQTFTLSGYTFPAHGTLVISGWIFEYTPTLGYVWSDNFTYTIEDQSWELSNTGTVSIMVTPVVNIPPVAFSGSYSLTEDTSHFATLSGSDANNDILTFSAAILPLHGMLSLTASGDFTYTPDPNYNGSDSFQFFAFDGQANSTLENITFSVISMPDAPVVVDDTVLVPKDENSMIFALENDTDADNLYQTQTLTITGYTLPLNGTLSVVGTGFYYTPTLGFSGTDSFQYSIADQDSNISNTGTVNITVSPVNHPPVASADVFTWAEDTQISSTLSWSDPDGTMVNYILDASPLNGTLVLWSTGTFIFTPNPNFHGSTVFLYHVSDGVLSSVAVPVTLNITSVNDIPVANNDTLNATEDTPITFTGLLLNDTDADSGAILAIGSIVTNPLHGVAVLTGTNLIDYMPNPNFCWTDMFTYNVQDEFSAISIPATVNIVVSCVNDAPLLSDSSWTLTGNISTNSGHILTVSLPSTDPDADILFFTLVSTTSTGNLSFTNSGTITYLPPLGFSGSTSFTYTAFDGFLTGSTVTWTIIVQSNAYNTPPISYNITFSWSEDVSIAWSFSGTDIENNPLFYSLVSTGTHGNIVLHSGWTFTYTPNSNYYGIDTINYAVSDQFWSWNISTITFSITSVNDAPITINDTGSILEDSVNTIFFPLLNDIDVDGDPITLTWIITSMHGIAMMVWQQVQYTPNPDYNGIDTLTYTITDWIASSTGQIIITIINVPDAPIAPNNTFHLNEDTSVLLNIYSGAVDPDGDTLFFTGFTTLPSHGSVSISGSLIQYTPNPDYNGIDTFIYQITDNQFVTNPITATLNIHPVNDAPVWIMDTITGTEDITMFIPILSNDNDIDGDILSVSSFTQPLHGTVSLSSTWIQYIPQLNFNGTDAFTYVLTDGQLTTGPISVNINIIPVNDAPIVSDLALTLTGNMVISPGIVLSGGTLSGYLETNSVFTGQLIAFDAENDPLIYTILNQPSSGTVSLLSGSTFLYIPANDFVGSVTFPFQVTDGILSSVTWTVSLCIISPNPNISLPSCASTYVPPVDVVIQGPGGWGGGWGSTTAAAAIFWQVTSNGVTSNLASQLLLSSRVLTASWVIQETDLPSLSQNSSGTVYSALLDSLGTAVKTTVDTFDFTSIQDSHSLRKNAQNYLRSVVQTSTLNSTQKVDALEEVSAKIVDSLMNENISVQQYGTLQYILRLFNAKKMYLLPSVQVWHVFL